jgi:hypothetical protein
MLTTSIKNANFYLLKHYPKTMKLEETYAIAQIFHTLLKLKCVLKNIQNICLKG